MTPIKNLLIVTKDHKVTTYEEVNQISMVTPDEIQIHHLGEYESHQINMVAFIKPRDIIRIEFNRGSEDEVIFNQLNFPEEEIPIIKDPNKIITNSNQLKSGTFYHLKALSYRNWDNFCYIDKLYAPTEESNIEYHYFLAIDSIDDYEELVGALLITTKRLLTLTSETNKEYPSNYITNSTLYDLLKISLTQIIGLGLPSRPNSPTPDQIINEHLQVVAFNKDDLSFKLIGPNYVINTQTDIIINPIASPLELD